MKIIIKGILSVLEIILFIINLLLSLVVIINIIVLISTRLFKNDYPTLLDYTYYSVKENNSFLGIKKDDFLLIDTRKTILQDNIVMYEENKQPKLAKVKESTEETSVLTDNQKETNITNETIIGTVIKKIPKAGLVLDKLLESTVFIISIAILIVTSIIQNFINKVKRKYNQENPDFTQNHLTS